jgi:ribosomal protein S12 methylthiotransferase accessory factor YcaO
MIVGLLILGSLIGMLAAIVTLITGQSLLAAVTIYFLTAALCVIGVPLICAFRPRARQLQEVQKGQGATLQQP